MVDQPNVVEGATCEAGDAADLAIAAIVEQQQVARLAVKEHLSQRHGLGIVPLPTPGTAHPPARLPDSPWRRGHWGTRRLLLRDGHSLGFVAQEAFWTWLVTSQAVPDLPFSSYCLTVRFDLVDDELLEPWW